MQAGFLAAGFLEKSIFENSGNVPLLRIQSK